MDDVDLKKIFFFEDYIFDTNFILLALFKLDLELSGKFKYLP